ncbi:hypothetical protein [Aeromicrobium sp. Sec7.5]|uniref:hypothetical protein n=1 Tax=Aeromicrobium sp. Sec7.5 TaxID=3121276 RepID=UPI002FE4943B
MGLIVELERRAARNAHVLVVEAPGHWQTRAAVERAIIERGWTLASSPADADVLAVCGEMGPRLAEAVEQVWHQLPGPRVRVEVWHRDEALTRLDDAYAGLLDTTHHRSDAQSRPAAQDLLTDGDMGHGDMGHGDMGHGDMGHGDMDHGDMDHGDMDHGDMDHGDMDHGDMDHGDMDHGDMDHGDMEMSPGGIPLAEGGEDRDGLEMDVLNVRLGPVLPHWPAGLVLCCALQGDVVIQAEAEFLDAGMSHAVSPRNATARRMDNIVALLALAGWGDAAAEARVIRDCLLGGGPDAEASARTARLVRRIRRSRVLRWSLRGVRPLSEEDLREHGLPTTLAGDTYHRLLRMLEEAETDVGGERASTDQLGGLVTGLDLATARLVLASLDLHELQSGAAERGASHV